MILIISWRAEGKCPDAHVEAREQLSSSLPRPYISQGLDSGVLGRAFTHRASSSLEMESRNVAGHWWSLVECTVQIYQVRRAVLLKALWPGTLHNFCFFLCKMWTTLTCSSRGSPYSKQAITNYKTYAKTLATAMWSSQNVAHSCSCILSPFSSPPNPHGFSLPVVVTPSILKLFLLNISQVSGQRRAQQ